MTTDGRENAEPLSLNSMAFECKAVILFGEDFKCLINEIKTSHPQGERLTDLLAKKWRDKIFIFFLHSSPPLRIVLWVHHIYEFIAFLRCSISSSLHIIITLSCDAMQD